MSLRSILHIDPVLHSCRRFPEGLLLQETGIIEQYQAMSKGLRNFSSIFHGLVAGWLFVAFRSGKLLGKPGRRPVHYRLSPCQY